MRVHLVTSMVLAALAATTSASAEPPPRIVVGIYAPSIDFGSAQARLSYVQGLARAIATATGTSAEAVSYATFAALRRGAPDIAIVETACVVANPELSPLAIASIGGVSSRPWALYAAAAVDLRAVRTQRLAFIHTGCDDPGFIDRGLFESELAGFFPERVAKGDVAAAIAEVSSYKGADVVLAPVGGKLKKVFETVPVANPALVRVSGKIDATLAAAIGAAVIGHRAPGAAISGWVAPSRSAYGAISDRIKQRGKRPVFAVPVVRSIDLRELVAVPQGDSTELVDVRHHLERAPERME